MSEDFDKRPEVSSPLSQTAPGPESPPGKSISAWLAKILQEDEEGVPTPDESPFEAATGVDPPPTVLMGVLDLEEPLQQEELGAMAELGGVYDEFVDTSEQLITSDPREGKSDERQPPSEATSVGADLEANENATPQECSADKVADSPWELELPRVELQPNKPAKYKAIATVPESKIEPSEQEQTTERKPQKSMPGGDLRALEQVLSRSSPGKIPAGFEKRATLAVRFLFTIPEIERAMVVIESETGELKALAAAGFKEEVELERTVPRGVLRSVLSTKNTMLLVDASKDSRFAHAPVVKEQGLRSILCVHFTDKIAGIQGLLYADNLSTPSVFSLSEQKKVEDFAHRLATEDSLGVEQELEPAQAPQLIVETQALSPWLYVGGALLALILVLPSLTKSDPKPTPTATATLASHQNADARVVLDSYIRSLGSSNYRGAYTMLSGERQAELTTEDFEKKMKAFFSKTDLAVQFANVKVSEKGSSDETRKFFSLQPPRQDLGPWELVMQRSEGVWYVSQIKGGPALP